MTATRPSRNLPVPGLVLAALAAAALACSPRPSPVSEPPAIDLPAPGEPDTAAAEALRLLTEPGEHHQHLDRLAGEWDLMIQLWPTPEAQPIESAGTAEARWILGGRFLWTVYRARLFGQPFEAWSIDGFDNQADEYVGTWRDTQGTYTLIYRGRCQPTKPPAVAAGAPPPPPTAAEGFEGAFRRMNSKLTDPVSGQEFKVRSEIEVEEEGDGFVLESFIVLTDGEELKNLRITGRRPPTGG